jgi:uncharacterized membrane protein
MIWFMSWLLVVIVAPMIVFAKYRGKLMALKREKNWRSAAAGRALVDIKAAAMPQKRISSFLFLPPVLAGFILIIYSLAKAAEFGLTLLTVIFTLMIIMFWLLYYLIFRLRAEVVNEDVTLTVALTRMRRYNWSIFFLFASWLTVALMFLTRAFIDSVTGLLIIPLGYALIMIIAAIWAEFGTRIAQQKLTAKNTGDLYLDEDDYWLFGIFYHNPNDNHFFVNDRVGMNMSINLAKPAGKFATGLIILILLCMPLMGVWMWKEETTPINLVLSENELKVRHTRYQYVVELGKIESVEVIEALPPMIRVAGTGMNNLYKGNFRAESYGAIHVCLRPLDPPFLVVRTDSNIYIVNDNDSDVTRRVYRQITPYVLPQVKIEPKQVDASR